MKKGDIVMLKEDSNQSSSDYIRAQLASYLCVVTRGTTSGDSVTVAVPSKQDGGADTDILYSKPMTIAINNLIPAEEKFDNMRTK